MKILNEIFPNLIKNNSNTALIWKSEIYSYEYLFDRVIFWNKKLETIPSKSIVGIESDFTPETISIFLALIDKEVIIVPLDITHSEINMNKIAISQIDFLINIESESNIKIVSKKINNPKNILYNSVFELDNPGLVLFTSGSSGKPKAALHDLFKLLLKYKQKRTPFITINFLLFDHWGGLNTLFHVLSNNGTVVLLENRNPDYVCSLIEKFKVELLPTSPTFLNMLLLSRAYERHTINTLKVITYGSEPMPENVLNKLNQLFPEVKLQQTYGLIELGVMSSKSKDNESLWVKIGGQGYEVRVVDGMLEIKSNSAMIGYLNATSPYTSDGWFITGDMVEVDGDYFKILGRKSELINVGGEKVYPQEVENIILTIDNILDVEVYGEKHPFTGNIVCAKIYHDATCDVNDLKKIIKNKCKSNLSSFKIPVKITFTTTTLFSNRFKKQRTYREF
jgi:acyl-CoA synthetase (AMP-forming)/AMP-acid ligase II